MAKKSNEQLMEIAIKHARKTMNKKHGEPFGAVIVNEKGKIIAIAANTILKDKDPTAHAEISAIRQATLKMKTHDLSGCILYTTAFPCPMCMGAIIWANIKIVHYGCNLKDTTELGFKNEELYKFIKSDFNNVNVLELSVLSQEKCLELFNEYRDEKK